MSNSNSNSFWVSLIMKVNMVRWTVNFADNVVKNMASPVEKSFPHLSYTALKEMRTRELRKLMLERLQVSHSVVSKILDKKELQTLAWSIVSSQQLREARLLFLSDSLWFAIVGALFIVGCVAVWLGLGFFRSYLISTQYEFSRRLSVLYIAYKKNQVNCFLILLCGIVGELLLNFLRMYSLLTWLLPADVIYRLSILSMPVGLETLGAAKRDTKDATSVPSFQVDVGPMIVIFVIQSLQRRMESFANKKLLEVHDKSALSLKDKME